MMPGGEREEIFSLQKVNLNEGEMWGRNCKDINKWVNGDGKLIFKFLIIYLSF